MGKGRPESTWNVSVPTALRTSWAQYFRRYWYYRFYRCHRIFEDHGAVGPKGGGERSGDVKGASSTATAPVKGLVALSVTVSAPGWVLAVVPVVVAGVGFMPLRSNVPVSD